MSLKPYIWNRNNPYDYSDPSGYTPDDVHSTEAEEASALNRAYAAREHEAIAKQLNAQNDGTYKSAQYGFGALRKAYEEPYSGSA
jgi:hypothetical protein